MAADTKKNVKKIRKAETSQKKETQLKTDAKSKEKAGDAEKEMKGLEKQLAFEKDRVLRLSAEFENYKKRKQRELDDFKKFANESVFRQFLTVVDNLERAISSAQENSDDPRLIEGVKLTLKEMLRMFETFNVKVVDAENQSFDPNFHQAVTREETDTVPENIVTKVLQKGYLLHDRLIRPAMVVVSKKKEIEKTKKT